MKDFIRSISEILQHSQTPLGILALACIVCPTLAYLLFAKDRSPKVRFKVFLSCLLFVFVIESLAIAVLYFRFNPPPEITREIKAEDIQARIDAGKYLTNELRTSYQAQKEWLTSCWDVVKGTQYEKEFEVWKARLRPLGPGTGKAVLNDVLETLEDLHRLKGKVEKEQAK